MIITRDCVGVWDSRIALYTPYRSNEIMQRLGSQLHDRSLLFDNHTLPISAHQPVWRTSLASLIWLAAPLLLTTPIYMQGDSCLQTSTHRDGIDQYALS